ncbi:MAG: hypothetical protein A2X64_01785 [Ignavibacteria bacterium GWF2_33_9]|nr:MAG: hypothetical protein A2X64_01785 [Ignavibacteria bacterium GWF2_33_9]
MFSKILNNIYIVLFCRILIGTFFIVVGVSKIGNGAEFAKEIGNYAIIPEQFLNLASIAFAWSETILGLFFIFGIEVKATGIAIFVFLLLFTTAIGIAILRGLSIECGCYSNLASQQVGIPKILENVVTMLLTLIVVFTNNIKFTLSYNK